MAARFVPPSAQAATALSAPNGPFRIPSFRFPRGAHRQHRAGVRAVAGAAVWSGAGRRRILAALARSAVPVRNCRDHAPAGALAAAASRAAGRDRCLLLRHGPSGLARRNSHDQARQCHVVRQCFELRLRRLGAVARAAFAVTDAGGGARPRRNRRGAADGQQCRAVSAQLPRRLARAVRGPALHRLSDRRGARPRLAQAHAAAVPVERDRRGHAPAAVAGVWGADHSRRLDLCPAACAGQPGDRPGLAGLWHPLRAALGRRPCPADAAGDLGPGRLARLRGDFGTARLAWCGGNRDRVSACPAPAEGVAVAGGAAQLSAVESPSPLEQLRRELALAVGENAVFDGWTAKAVDSAAAQLGLDPVQARLAMPKTQSGMIDVYIQEVDRGLEAYFTPKRLAGMKIREKIRALVWQRLEIMGPAREAVRRAVAILAMPQDLPLALRISWRSADLMWRIAGDTSTDFNHYTKRMTLGD